MKRKELFQGIISTMQEEMPFAVKERDLTLPIDARQIIAITGVRRCGKSYLMKIAANRIIAGGVPVSNILWVNFDDERLDGMSCDDLDDVLVAYREMYPDIPLKNVYMFFDEIQNIDRWELFIIRVYKSYCQNIFLSGSNSKMLSSQISTSLRGWPLEYVVYPLSFPEFIRFKGNGESHYSETGRIKLKRLFGEYIMGSAFPEVVLMNEKSMKLRKVQGYFNTMLLRDLAELHGIASVETLRYFLKRIMANLSKPTSINKIYNEIKSQGKKADKNRLYEFTDMACSAFLFFKVNRWSRSMIEENNYLPKYYVIDNGMRNAVILPQSNDEGKLLENAVFLELKRKSGPGVNLYYFNEGVECDFIVQENETVTHLIQVCWEIPDNETLHREIRGLKMASEATGCKNCMLITMEDLEDIESDGLTIRCRQAWKWFYE